VQIDTPRCGVGEHGVVVGRITLPLRVSAILRAVALPGADDEAQLGHVQQAPDRLGVDITDHAGTDDREPDLGG
jgi:hypothetical protein